MEKLKMAISMSLLLLVCNNIGHGHANQRLRKVCSIDKEPSATLNVTQSHITVIECARQCDVMSECDAIGFHDGACVLMAGITTCVGLSGALWEVYQLVRTVPPACKAGWHPVGGSCYHVTPTPVTWAEAELFCVDRQAHLATIQSPLKVKLFVDLLWTLGIWNQTDRVWIGGTDGAIEGEWRWASGEPWVYQSWRTGEPNNAGDEDCLLMVIDLLWNDGRCWNPKLGVCELDRLVV